MSEQQTNRSDAEKVDMWEAEFTERRQRILESLTPQQRDELVEAEKGMQEVETRKAQLEADQSNLVLPPSGDGPFNRHPNEDKVAEVFNRMTPGERTQLYVENEKEWQRGLDAVEAVGLRKLMGS